MLKLRTVLWDFSVETIDAGLLCDLEPLAEEIPDDVAEHLTWFAEVALVDRVQDVLACRRFPEDHTGMAFPWPLV